MAGFNLKTLLTITLAALASTTVIASPIGAKEEKRTLDAFGDALSMLANNNFFCFNPPKRKEWRQLTTTEKSNYINAVKCLMNKPTKYGAGSDIPGAVNRFDDFHGVHISQTMSIHFVGHFLPWHRYFVATYEKALREECGYTGGQPYWDWSIDADKGTDYALSPLFDPVTGFGGDGEYVNATGPFVIPGHTGGGCISDGPFANMEVHVGPASNLNRNNRCLKRDFAASVIYNFANTAKVNEVMSQKDFWWFTKKVDGEPNFQAMGIHGPGHFGVGGEAGDMYSSPGEPLFYLHHANLDRIWWEWEKQNLFRLLDIDGPVNMMDYSGPNVTLAFPINLGRLAPQVTIAHLMHIQIGSLCYTYA